LASFAPLVALRACMTATTAAATAVAAVPVAVMISTQSTPT
jgi:hypothetical protein